MTLTDQYPDVAQAVRAMELLRLTDSWPGVYATLTMLLEQRGMAVTLDALRFSMSGSQDDYDRPEDVPAALAQMDHPQFRQYLGAVLGLA